MMTAAYDLLIRNGKLVAPDGLTAGSIAVRSGHIAALLEPDTTAKAVKTVDAEGRPILPGLIDTHVHLGNAGRSFAEDCRSESGAAASGGVTTMLVYAITQGSVGELISEWSMAASAASRIDLMFHAGVVDVAQIAEIPTLARDFGIRSFKAFMAYKGKEASPSGIKGLSDGELFAFLKAVGQIPNGVALVHCENMELIEWCQGPARSQGIQTTAAWSDSRPPFGELEAIAKAIRFAREAEVDLYLPHIGLGDETEFLRFKENGKKRIAVETCPHYLVLHKDMDLGVAGKVNPPLRDIRNVERLWDRLIDGTVDFLGSDHCAYTRQVKGSDIWTARAGITGGIAMILPTLYTAGVLRGRLSLERIVELTSSNPAKAFGLYPTKGALSVGSDADFIVLDEQAEVHMSPQALNTAADYTPYEGMQFRGWPLLTVARGDIVYERGGLSADDHKGAVLSPNGSARRDLSV